MKTLKNFFEKNNTLTVLLGIIGTILLGALGSGVWEYLLKPLFESGTKIILDIATLGIEAFKNDVYVQIAKGFSESNSIKSYSSIMLFLLTVMIFSIMIMYYKLQRVEKTHNGNIEQNEKVEPFEVRIKKFKRQFYFSFFYVAIFFIFHIFNIFRLTYINNSIVYYEQLKKASTPYISQRQLLVFESRFTLITNREDYILVTSDLEKVLNNENINIKKVEIW